MGVDQQLHSYWLIPLGCPLSADNIPGPVLGTSNTAMNKVYRICVQESPLGIDSCEIYTQSIYFSESSFPHLLSVVNNISSQERLNW